jgi:hypothetical protein
MLRNSNTPELYQAAAAEERVFSENFIQHQLHLVTTASQVLTQASLLEERKVMAMMNYMRDIYANTENGSVNGRIDKTRNYTGLLALIDEAISRFTQHYQWSGTHPLLPAMKKIRKNVIDNIGISQPQSLFELDSSLESTCSGDIFDVMQVNPSQLAERVFSDNFIRQQLSHIVTASHLVTDEGILEKERVKMLLDYMQDLVADPSSFSISGKQTKGRNYAELQIFIDDFSKELKNNYRWSNTHPLLPALAQIKKNIQAYICIAQPQFSQNLQLDQGNNQSSVASSRWAIVQDTCGILACLAWAIPEKIITLDNGCETTCGSEEACCPEVKLPTQSVSCNLWTPKNSIRAFCKDISEQNEKIDSFKAAPIRHTMS